MSGVMILHEIMHETKRRNEIGIIIKLDFEKHMTKLTRNLCFTVCIKDAFIKKWMSWIKGVVSGGNISVKVNNKVGKYVSSYKG